jgi:pre-mRNA-splicing factor SYF1
MSSSLTPFSAPQTLSVQARLFKSLKLWSFYVDLEESIGTVETTKEVYDRILELRIANAQIIINYAAFLEENKYFEESFKIYERGVDLFTFPIAFEIWNVYLSKFVKRYGGTKLERTRDLFEQALEKCPDKFCKPLFLMFAQLEEEHGLAKRAMAIYDRATRAVKPEDKFEVGRHSLILGWMIADALLSDVYYLHRQGDGQLWPPRNPADLSAGD